MQQPISGTVEHRSSNEPVRGLCALALATLMAMAVLSGAGGVVGSAAAANAVGGCTTIDQPGEYVLDADVTDSGQSTCIEITASDVIFDGDGHTIDGTNASGSIAIVANGPSQSNVTVRDVTVTDWGRAVRLSATGSAINGSHFERIVGNWDMIDLNGVQDTVVADNTFESPSDSTYPAGIRSDRQSSDVTVVRNTFSSFESGQAGINLWGESMLVRNNDFDVSTKGVSLNHVQGATVADNVYQSDGTAIGVEVYESSDVVVRDNDVDSAYYNVEITASHDVTLHGNTLTGAGKSGIEIPGPGSPSDNITISDTTITGSAQEGIIATGLNDSTITGTVIENNGDSGVAFRGGSNLTVSDTTLSSNRNGSLRVVDSSDVTVDTVTSDGAAAEGLRAKGGGSIDVDDLTVTDAGGDGLTLWSVDATVTDSLVADAGGNGIDARGGTVSIADTAIRRSGSYGLWAQSPGLSTTNLMVRNSAGTGLKVRQPDQVHTDLTVVDNGGHGISTAFDVAVTGSETTVTGNAQYGAEAESGAVLRLDGATVGDNGIRDLSVISPGVVDAEGLTLTSSPAPTVPVDVRLADMQLTAADAIPAAPGDNETLGRAVNVSVAPGATAGSAGVSANVTFLYDSSDVDGVEEDTLAVYRHEGGWTRTDGGLDAADNAVFGNVSAGGTLVPMAEPATTGGGSGGGGEDPGSPDIVVDDADLSATEVAPGDRVTVAVDLANDGDGGGTTTVEVTVDGEVVYSQSVFVDAGGRHGIDVRHRFADAGEYEVAVNGEDVGTVTVASQATATATATPSPTPVEATTPSPTPTATPADDEGGAPTPDDGGGVGPFVIVVVLAALAGIVGAGLLIARNE